MGIEKKGGRPSLDFRIYAKMAVEYRKMAQEEADPFNRKITLGVADLASDEVRARRGLKPFDQQVNEIKRRRQVKPVIVGVALLGTVLCGGITIYVADALTK